MSLDEEATQALNVLKRQGLLRGVPLKHLVRGIHMTCFFNPSHVSAVSAGEVSTGVTGDLQPYLEVRIQNTAVPFWPDTLEEANQVRDLILAAWGQQ